MRNLIRREIELEARKRLLRFNNAIIRKRKYRRSFTLRTGVAASPPQVRIPLQWQFHRHFDPRYCIKHSKFLAKGLWNSLKEGKYDIVPSYRLEIPKLTGGTRIIDCFSIPDTVVARIFYNNLRSRNSKIFSDASYAYQENKTPLDAVLKLKNCITNDTIFVSKYDFSKYFDSVDHAYIEKLIANKTMFLTTQMERKIIRSTFSHVHIRTDGEIGIREQGFPQGNSISLFLANVAAHPLDLELSRLSGSFARFADDSVVITYTYEDALKCAAAYTSFSRASGVAINEKKSSGIRILSDSQAELHSISSFNFLSYSFSRSGLSMSDHAVSRVKAHCMEIIFNNLMMHNKRMGAFNCQRFGNGFRDWELVTCVNELRRYIYGRCSQSDIDDFLLGVKDIKNVQGAVSYFCLVEDSSIFRQLDGWLHDNLARAYRERRRLALVIAGKSYRSPISRPRLISGDWYRYPTIPHETRLPSFYHAWRAARKSWLRHGLGGVDAYQGGYVYL